MSPGLGSAVWPADLQRYMTPKLRLVTKSIPTSTIFCWFFFSSLHLDAPGHAVPLAGSGSVSGLTCVVINVLLYGSPLVMMKTVIQTRSVKCFGSSEKQGRWIGRKLS